MSRTLLIVLILALLAVASVVVAAQRRGVTAAGSSAMKSASTPPATPEPASSATKGVGRIVKSDAEWKKQLTAEQYRVLRHEGTEMAFTGRYWNNHAKGVYRCAGCGLELFSSETKFESGTGWPSFWQPIEKTHVSEVTDSSLGVVRTEVECARCGGHLGHVFEDGPKPTGLRYCINSASLSLVSGK